MRVMHDVPKHFLVVAILVMHRAIAERVRHAFVRHSPRCRARVAVLCWSHRYLAGHRSSARTRALCHHRLVAIPRFLIRVTPPIPHVLRVCI